MGTSRGDKKQVLGSKMKFAIVLLGAGLASAAPKAEPEAARLLFPGTSIGGSVAVGRTVGVIGKREADAEALHGTVATTLYNTRISKPIKKVGPPDCVSTPVRQCE